jgi:hypothetical protein
MQNPEDTDPRVTCNACRNAQRGYCADHKRAGLATAPIGPDFAVMLQHCPAFVPKPMRKVAA